MKRIFSYLLVGGILFTACKSTKEENDTETAPLETVENKTTAKESVDILGTYRATLPCEDCKGIQTEITISSDETFRIKSKYLGKSEKVSEDLGDYMWQEDGNTLMLEGIDSEPVLYEVLEGKLIQLNEDGKKIKGKHEKSYVFLKD